MKRIIVTRFSAMGDVAMVASVLKEFVVQQKDVEIIFVSRVQFAPFFVDIPRVRFHVMDPKIKHKGIIGLIRLFRELKKYKPTEIADLHNNLRSLFLVFLFKASNYQVSILDKRRKQKKLLTRRENKILRPLDPVTECYGEVFRKLGYNFTLSHQLNKVDRKIPRNLIHIFNSNDKKIGIAPFAKHKYKVFPIIKMEETIRDLCEKNYHIFLFGGSEEEKSICEKWAKQYPKTTNTIGKHFLSEELDIIANLDVMISMDSSGMHMASLVGTRCLSIWGATHPYAGFLGYGQSMDDCIQVEHPARPSSIYGNKPCLCDGVEAIELVTVEMVTKKIEEVLG
ncbi:glycosyltransferase family 9 protein [Belliella marina]|uniref:Glycosyltransferase family 9 protein n=1 Tax=Belliella marina TaxID=1644146 RepID=A0ABW4VS34_9BACT